jgi:hypothetical protein
VQPARFVPLLRLSTRGGVGNGARFLQCAIQVFRRWIWLDAERLLQQIAARLILPQRFAAPALPGIERHQRAMRRLADRVERQELLSSLGRAIQRARRIVVGQQPPHRPQRQVAQPLPLCPQPVLERLLRQAEAGKQLRPVERSRLLESCRHAGACQALEGRHVDFDVVGTKPDLIAIGNQPLRIAERLAEVGQGAPQAAARLFVVTCAP